MSSKPIFYSWDDVGSPGRNLSGNHQNRLKQILKACLVDGYGDKKGAGWTIGHEHPNGFSLVNGRGDFVVNFVSGISGINSNAIRVYAANSIIDVSSAIIDGTNLCSGEFRKNFNNSTNFQYIGYVQNSLNPTNTFKWTVLATEGTFIISAGNPVSSNGSYPEDQSLVLYVGDFKQYEQITGASIALSGRLGDNKGVGPLTLSEGYSSPINPLNGLSTHHTITSDPFSYLDTNYNGSAEKVIKELHLQSPTVLVNGEPAGTLYGAVYDTYLTLRGGWPTFLEALGLEADINNRNTIVKIGDFNYCYFTGKPSAGTIVTDNPTFWGGS